MIHLRKQTRWAFVVVSLFLSFVLAGITQCARRAEGTPESTPSCRKWSDGIYRRAVMRRIGDTFVISYQYCKPATRTGAK